MDAEWGPWILEGRTSARLSQEEFAVRLREAGSTPGVDGYQVGRWERGKNVTPGPLNRAALRVVLGQPPWEGREVGLSPTQPGVLCGTLSAVKRREFLSLAIALGLPVADLTSLLGSVARESVDETAMAELSNVGPAALVQLQVDVRRMAHSYIAGPPQPLLAQMILTLDEVKERLAGRQRPAQTTDLYLLAGQLHGLLSNGSLDMGDFESAAAQARSAWVYGDAIGHDGLRAWARGMESMAARWGGDLDVAVALVRSGLTYASEGTPKARLYGLLARTLGQMGDIAGTQQALAYAEEQMGRIGRDELHDDVGGEFGFDGARFAHYVGMSFFESAAHAEQEQADELHWAGVEMSMKAIQVYQTGPPELRSYGCEAMSLMGVATAHIHIGELEGARERLEPVLALPETHHLVIFTRGMNRVQQLLDSPRYRTAAAARELRDNVATFYEQLPTKALAG